MKKNLKNKLNMYETIMLVLTTNAVIVALRPALVSAEAALLSFVLAIRTADEKQRSVITGVAQDKKVLKGSVVKQIFSVASAIKAFAEKTGDLSLFGKVKQPLSYFAKLNDELLPQTAQMVHDLATTNLVGLADYGITAAVLTAFQTTIDDYKVAAESPRKAVSERKTQTDLLPILFKDASDFMSRQMDAIVETLRATNAEFVSTYFNARGIVDAGIHHTTLKGKVTELISGNAIVGALITIIEIDRSAKSEIDGVYGIHEFKGGIYSIIITAPGYIDVKLKDVFIGLGKGVELNVEMEKVS